MPAVLVYKAVISCWVKARFQMPMSSSLPLNIVENPDDVLAKKMN